VKIFFVPFGNLVESWDSLRINSREQGVPSGALDVSSDGPMGIIRWSDDASDGPM
jgi:hypothetical protein